MHDDALADRLAGSGIVQDQVVIERAKFLMAEHWSGDFGQGVLQRKQRQPRRAKHARLVFRGEGGWVNRAITRDELRRREVEPVEGSSLSCWFRHCTLHEGRHAYARLDAGRFSISRACVAV